MSRPSLDEISEQIARLVIDLDGHNDFYLTEGVTVEQVDEVRRAASKLGQLLAQLQMDVAKQEGDE